MTAKKKKSPITLCGKCGKSKCICAPLALAMPVDKTRPIDINDPELRLILEMAGLMLRSIARTR